MEKKIELPKRGPKAKMLEELVGEPFNPFSEDSVLAERARNIMPLAYENWHPELQKRAPKPLFSAKITMDALQTLMEHEHLDIPELRQCWPADGRHLFLKLSSRCPKDYLASGVLDMAKPDPITTYSEAIEALRGSERTVDDLVGFYSAKIEPMVHIYHYIRIPVLSEFRCFVKDRRLIAMSQYYYQVAMAENSALETNRLLAAKAFINEIAEYLPCDDIVVDLIIPESVRMVPTPVKMLELNPYGLSDPCMFTYSYLEEACSPEKVEYRYSTLQTNVAFA